MLTTLAYHLHLYVFLAQREKRKNAQHSLDVCALCACVSFCAVQRQQKCSSVFGWVSAGECGAAVLWGLQWIKPVSDEAVVSHRSAPLPRCQRVVSLVEWFQPYCFFFYLFLSSHFFLHIARWSFTGFPRLEKKIRNSSIIRKSSCSNGT